LVSAMIGARAMGLGPITAGEDTRIGVNVVIVN
jgi:serine acetyltransferase